MQKQEDPDAFTIPCTIELLYFAKALCDLGVRIKFVPLSTYKRLGLGDSKPTAMWLLMANRMEKRLIRIIHDILMLFIFLVIL